MVAIPLIYWGMGILAAGGATVALRNLQEEEELRRGRIDLPDIMSGGPEPEPESEQTPPKRPNNSALRTAMEAMIASETKQKENCDDTEQQDCPYCKPAVEGKAVWQHFDGGPVRKATPKARGSLYQHYVVPWFGYRSDDTSGRLTIEIEEWEWRRGKAAAWDGLDYAQCKLYECKMGYRDFLDEDLIGKDDAYTYPNPKKPWLRSLEYAFEIKNKQLSNQYNTFIGEWPRTTLEWVFSDQEVMWQFIKMRGDMNMNQIDNRHVPYDLAPSGTQFVRELYASGEEDYGYWEDS
ncbi:MAG: hypothetical protein ACK5NN_05005 [Sphingomonadaceae bacterium]